MAKYTPANALEISDGNCQQTDSHSRRVFPWRWIVSVVIVVLLIAVMGVLMAMFGPGSKDLKYHDREDCKGKQRVFRSQLMFHCKKSWLKCDLAQIKESKVLIPRNCSLREFDCAGNIYDFDYLRVSIIISRFQLLQCTLTELWVRIFLDQSSIYFSYSSE